VFFAAPLNSFVNRLWLQAVGDHPDAWPFKEPVNARDVPDYYEIIKDPMGELIDGLTFRTLASRSSWLKWAMRRSWFKLADGERPFVSIEYWQFCRFRSG
jgi:hypothetical protein